MEQHRPYLELAMRQAEQAAGEQTFPVGAVLVGPDGRVISAARNGVHTGGDATAHAEVEALRQAGRTIIGPEIWYQCTMYVTMEPCLMCFGALLMAHVDRVVWATDDDFGGAVRGLAGQAYLFQEPAGPAHLYRRLAAVRYIAAPLGDLDRRQRELMAAWDQGRGRDGARWLRPAGGEP